MEKEQIEKMESPTDPERCQGTTKLGQCEFKGVKLASGGHGAYCMIHGGNQALKNEANAGLRQYRLGRWQAQLERFADSPILKDLRDEIGILRMILEEKILQANTPMELALMAGPISDLVMKVEKLVSSCHKLEGSMGHHLDKAAIIQLAGQMTTIMSMHLKDQPELLNKIGADFVNLIREETFNETE